MFYAIVVIFTLFFTTSLSLWVGLTINSVSFAYALLAPFAVNAYVLVLLGLLAILLRFFPKGLWNYRSTIFKVNQSQIKFLRSIKIQKWKDKIPEMGWTGGFEKKNIKSVEVKYLNKFLQETCLAEILHLLAGILGFTVLFIFPVRDLYFSLPIAIVNLILHILPCLIQRYTRFRMVPIYEHLSKKQIQTV